MWPTSKIVISVITKPILNHKRQKKTEKLTKISPAEYTQFENIKNYPK